MSEPIDSLIRLLEEETSPSLFRVLESVLDNLENRHPGQWAEIRKSVADHIATMEQDPIYGWINRRSSAPPCGRNDDDDE